MNSVMRNTALLGCGIVAGTLTSSFAVAQDVTDDKLAAMQALIEQQQRQLDEMRAQLEQMQRKVETAAVPAVAAAPAAEAGAATAAGVPPDQILTSGGSGLKLSVSGQINQAINIVDDGANTRAYYVDNDVSNTRFRFEGTGELEDGVVVGAALELGVSPNNSYDVSQENQTADDFIDVRKAEGIFFNKRYGKIHLGKGQAASDDVAEYDLSLVAGPIMYSGVADPVGGMRFTAADGTLTSITVGDAFFNFDGDRQNRVAYISPVFGGTQIAASTGANSRWDVALKFGYDYNDWTGITFGDVILLGGIYAADPAKDNVDLRVAGSASILHEPSGFSFTASGGYDDTKTGSDPYNSYFKIGYDTNLNSWGPTGFGLDYTFSKHLAGQGDEGSSFGFAVVQLIEKYGVELYGQLRNYELDRASGPAVNDMFVGTIGTRVKF